MAYKKGKITEVAPVQQEKEQQDTLIQTESEEKEMQEERTVDAITDDDVKEAAEVLRKYHAGKKNLENTIVENEEWWRLRHWDYARKEQEEEAEKRIEPRSAWLFNALANKHADIMDNFPEANVLPREKNDERAAKALSEIIPVILERNEFEETYSAGGWYKLKNGTCVTGVFWDGSKDNGLGDISIKNVDIMNLFWEPGVKDIQRSKNVFYVSMEDVEDIKAAYPDKEIMAGSDISLTQYIKSDAEDNTEKVAVVDWYYKKTIVLEDNNGLIKRKNVLHYCKFCNGKVLYATENDDELKYTGLYDHGLYPFVFDVLFPIESSVCGFGYIDVMKDTQAYIDKMQQGILENGLSLAKPRWAVRDDVGLNENDFCDFSKSLVHFSGNLGEDAFRQITSTPMAGIYETILNNKIEELKDTSGNTAAAQGQTSNVTSASGIASLQEASGKLSRDANRADYRAFKKICYLVIELIRQFYDEPREFRITGETGQTDYVTFDNSTLKGQPMDTGFGQAQSERVPIFDVKVVPAKQSAYTREKQNQLALQFYNLGFFNPQNAEMTIGCLDMMDFDGKDEVKQRLNKSQTYYNLYLQMQQQALALAQAVDMSSGGTTNYAERIAGNAQIAMQQAEEPMAQSQSVLNRNSNGSLTSQAAHATRNSTSV